MQYICAIIRGFLLAPVWPCFYAKLQQEHALSPLRPNALTHH